MLRTLVAPILFTCSLPAGTVHGRVVDLAG